MDVINNNQICWVPVLVHGRVILDDYNITEYVKNKNKITV